MLNETQKAIVEASIESIFFDLIEKLPNAVQAIACQAVLKFPTFVKYLPLLEQNKIKEIVQQMGEIINHPAPQNPPETYPPLSEDSLAPLPPYVSYMIGDVRIGYFNLLSRNEADQAPPTAQELKIYIESLLKKRLANALGITGLRSEEWNSQPQLAEPTSEQTNSASKKIRFPKELPENIGKQLNILKITASSFIKCTESQSLPFYRAFLMQFGINVASTPEAVNSALKKWHKAAVDEYKATLNYALMEAEDIPFNLVVAAKLNDFTDFFKFPRANFNSFKALKRLALLNGHLKVYMQQEVVFDSYETSYLLIKLNNYPLFANYFEKMAQELPPYCANRLIAVCLSQPVVNLDILNYLLNFSQVAPGFLNSKISALLAKNNPNQAIFLVSKVFLRCLKFIETLSKETAQAAFQLAMAFNDFEMQALVLNQSPADFSARSFLSRETFFDLARQGFYEAVEKVAKLQMPRLLSIKDLRRVEEITEGKFGLNVEDSLVQIRCNLYWEKDIPNSALLTNFQRQQAALSTNDPAAVQATPNENRQRFRVSQ